ncbi:outer membrane protein assembly factor BamB family protein [Bythopirellula polymerisocia]|uniref:Outer membrane biogenesis protein BamB n=1 Tax=Bythopirellula polymerisocia TaxID=2528003 RepID=A0A5C6CLW7_9BACT|nr:PQQ-binding-like beta-propeller repeat protein [Bythopirellula polymerisocia]TWU23829.1 outer membrane biogenesis protein BamB [Bythopirellula polymerisocia]
MSLLSRSLRLGFCAQLVLLPCLCLTVSEGTGTEPYWNQFRGPHGDGETSIELPSEFGESDRVTWKTPIHDKGWSSPVVWGDQIWLTTATEDGKKLYAVCVNADTGAIEYDILVFEVAEPKFCHPTNSYASCTPFVEEGRVYVHFGEYGTACLDTNTGEKLWERRDFVCEDFRGPASSPIVDGDRLFLLFDGIDNQFVVALDKHTGETIWKTIRDIDYGTEEGDYKKGYCTPTLIEVDGQKQIICPAAVETIAYDPATGEVIWRIRHEGMNAAARPLYENGMVYISAGDGETSLVALNPEGTGDVTESHISWNTGKAVPERSSLIVANDRLYMTSDSGVLSCLDALTGESIWVKRLTGEYWASPLLAGENLYFFSKDGKVSVIAAADEYRLVAENQFSDGFNASPAVIDDAIILRSFTHLYRIE